MSEIFNFTKIKEAIYNIGSNKAISDKPQHLPLLRNFSANKQYFIVSSIMIASIAGSMGLFFQYFNRNLQLDQRIESSTNLKMLTQRVAKNLQKSNLGNGVEYKLVEIDTASLEIFVNKYKDGLDDFEKLETNLLEEVLIPIQEKYNLILPKMKTFNKNKDAVLSVKRESKFLTKELQDLNSELDELYILSLQRGGNSVKIAALQTLESSITNFNKNLKAISNSATADFNLLADINADNITIQKVFKYLLEDEPIEDQYILKELTKIKATYNPSLENIPNILNKLNPLLESKIAALESLNLFDSLYYDVDKLRDLSQEEKEEIIKIYNYGFLFVALAALSMLLLAYINTKEAKIREWTTKKENDATDDAVINLMQELIPIAEGNLKSRTTVTEHVTGALADRINEMAESLQIAVKNTRETSSDVANQMSKVKNMISLASELSKNAEIAAKKSNEASIAGSDMVNQAAEKMEDARNKMQETSKRVKRLGEVSQSIGLVTDLIEEMTEKTAILALNTQLKAAESGSDGNSFRVIAEEIRKLSDEAKKSLSTIRSSVQNMQSETHTVMLSIEQTTANVVEGSILWEKAEKDLVLIQEAANKIEEITFQLNELSGKQVENAQTTQNNMSELDKSISHFTV